MTEYLREESSAACAHCSLHVNILLHGFPVGSGSSGTLPQVVVRQLAPIQKSGRVISLRIWLKFSVPAPRQLPDRRLLQNLADGSR
jgi:hypothetical protein